MRITVRNLGVIDEAELDLKPLTVFVGPNNAGKTWLAYIIAGILGQHGWTRYLNAYITGKVEDIYPSLDNAIDCIMNGGDTTIDLVQFIEEYGEEYVNNSAKFAKQWMREFMLTALVKFENLEVNFSLGDLKGRAIKEVLMQSLNTQFGVGQGKRRPLLSLLKESGNPGLYILTSTEEGVSEQIPRQAIRNIVVRNVFELLRKALFTDKAIFPTERTTYITFPLGDQILDLGESDKIPERKGGVRLSGPVSFFLTMIRNTYRMDLLEKELRAELAEKNDIYRAYTGFAQLLEEIMGGSIHFSTPEPGLYRELLFQASNQERMEMPVASSMVKELSSVVLYLRYLAEPGDWVVIDEPEMNLHPEAQVKIMEFLAILANAGLRVLITTHSPNMVDHLENLIRAAEYRKKDQALIAKEFFLHRSDAFISQEDVSIYLVDHKKAENILLEEGKINWGTFGDVSDRVARIHYQL